MLCSPAFPLVPLLPSAGSAADRPALFVGVPGTMSESDFSGPFIGIYGASASTPRPHARLAQGSPEISRFPSTRRTRMPGSSDDAESLPARGSAVRRIAFWQLDNIGTPNGKSFVAQ